MSNQPLADFLLARTEESEVKAVALAALAEAAAIRGRANQAQLLEQVQKLMLAECEAKRRIVRGHLEQRRHGQALAENLATPDAILAGAAVTMAAFEFAVRSLAAVYVDHPDYREEWKP